MKYPPLNAAQTETKITVEFTRLFFGVTRKRRVDMTIPLHPEHVLFTRTVMDRCKAEYPKWTRVNWVIAG